MGIAKKYEAEDLWLSEIGNDGRRLARLLINANRTQVVLDALQGALGKSPSSRILVMLAEAILPRVNENQETQGKRDSTSTTREELYNQIEKNAQLNN